MISRGLLQILATDGHAEFGADLAAGRVDVAQMRIVLCPRRGQAATRRRPRPTRVRGRTDAQVGVARMMSSCAGLHDFLQPSADLDAVARLGQQGDFHSLRMLDVAVRVDPHEQYMLPIRSHG